MPKGRRAVAVTNGAIAAGLVLVLAAVALVVKPPAPPGLAEFAPQASKPITKAPIGQTALTGDAAGPCTAGQICNRAHAGKSPNADSLAPLSSPVARVASAVQCYTWPDGSTTQTFDPQSPPCIADWSDRARGNGGSTSVGVTKSEIRVAVPRMDDKRADDAMLAFFNTRFQLYGRHVSAVNAGGGSFSDDPSTEKAAADEIAANHVFAALPRSSGDDDGPTYTQALNRKGVLALSHGSPLMTSDSLRRADPLLWSFGLPADVVLRALARLYCGTLKGRSAEDAGPQYQRTPRKSVILLGSPEDWQQPNLSPLRSGLAGCGVSLPTLTMPKQSQTSADWSAFAVNLEQQGYTTLLFVGTDDARFSMELAADRISYQPEYVLPGLGGDYRNSLLPVPNQERHSFGLATFNKYLPYTTQPWMRAVLTVDPGYKFPAVGFSYYRNRVIYEELLTLFSGLQMAGPRLTAQSFAAGLRGTPFPNPGADEKPTYQAHVGYDSDDHSMIDTLGVWWVDPNQPNPESGKAVDDPSRPSVGGYCWYAGGQRWPPTAIPPDLHLFTGRCR